MFFFPTENEAGEVVSPMHDIPLYANDAKNVYNMVVEVPRWTNAKMEVIQRVRNADGETNSSINCLFARSIFRTVAIKTNCGIRFVMAA